MRSLLFVVMVIGCGSSGSPETDGGLADNGLLGGETSACPVGNWCIEASPVANRLTDVWAVPGDAVYAVGQSGTILRRRGGTWTQMTSNTTANLLGVWAASATDLWAVAENGTVLRSNGTTWSVVPNTGITSEVKSVWGSSATDVWLAGVGAIHHWNGSTWSTQGFAGQFYGISGSGPYDVWAGGANNGPVLRRYTGSWGSVTHGLGNTTIFTVLVLAANNVWATSAVPNKESVQWNGSTWTPRPVSVGTALQKLWAAAPNTMWGVGATRVARWNGSSWTVTQPLGSTVSLSAVAGLGTSIWVVGGNGLIASHRD
ncbi:MAG: hypothetical protein WKG01_40710 [Kofleriaceae bacterium]